MRVGKGAGVKPTSSPGLFPSITGCLAMAKSKRCCFLIFLSSVTKQEAGSIGSTVIRAFESRAQERPD